MRILQKSSTDGWDSLSPDELIVVEDLQAGRARLANSVERAPENLGDLTEVSGEPIDNLAASATIIEEAPSGGGGVANLTPKQAKGPTPAQKLASSVFQVTTDSDLESLSPRTVKQLQKEVAKLSATPQGRAELVTALGNADEAERRLAKLQRLSEEFATDPQAAAVQRIAETADERAASGAARAPRQSILDGVGPGLPSVVERFNSLPESVKADIVRRLDPVAQQVIESGGGVLTISPNAAADLVRPVNEVDGLLAQIDEGLRTTGETSEVQAARDLVRGAPAEQRQSALAAFRRRQAIEASMRSAMAQSDPPPQVLASPGQPSLRRPGALTPEAAIENVPASEIPGPFEDSLAAANERRARLEERSAGGGLTESERKEMSGIPEGGDLRKAPMYLKGRDGRPSALESRSRGSRSIESNDVRVLKDYTAALEKVNTATTPEETAEALAELHMAESALERKYPRGRKAMPDSRLNTAGQAETYDDLVMAVAGFRPKPGVNLNRASPSMTAAERGAQQAEAVRAFGEDDALELMPDAGEVDDVSEFGGVGKKGRLGGRQQFSRRAFAIDELFSQAFGGQNPLELEQFAGDPLRIADEILAKNRIFKPGTGNWDMAREKIAQAVEERFRTQRTGLTDAQASAEPSQPVSMSQNPADVPALQGRENVAGAAPEKRPTRDFSMPAMAPGQTASPAAGYVPEQPDFSNDLDAAPVPKSRVGRRAAAAKTPEEAALEASAVELNDSAPIPEAGASTAGVADSKPIAAAAGPQTLVDSKPIDSLSPAERKQRRDAIEAAASAAEQEEYTRAQSAGMGHKEALKSANAHRKEVQKQLLVESGFIPAADAAATVTPAAASVAPSSPIPAKPAGETAAGKPAGTPAGKPAGDAAAGKPDGKPAGEAATGTPDGKPARKPAGDSGESPPKGKPPEGDSKKGKTTPDAPPRNRLPYWLTGTALATGGAVALSNLGGGGADASVDGPRYPVPPGSEANPVASAEEVDAINKALARLRGARSSSGGTTQVIQNWTGWR
jgi:hypothetical protein